jgi:hypothetical protein
MRELVDQPETRPGAVLWSLVVVVVNPLNAKSGLAAWVPPPMRDCSMMMLWPKAEIALPTAVKAMAVSAVESSLFRFIREIFVSDLSLVPRTISWGGCDKSVKPRPDH